MQPIRVLVVDDEEDFASAIVDRLKRRGFLADASFSGWAALESVQSAEYDAVVLDLKMPEMNGLETLKKIRQIDPDVQVIVLTGHGTVSEGIGGMQLGAADFLQKPVEIEVLCTSLEAAAEHCRSVRSMKAREAKKQEGGKQ
jgi:two-component system OmpR family response regulator